MYPFHGESYFCSATPNVLLDANFARMHLDAREGAYVAITIMDTGVGIPVDVLDRMFEPFFTTKELGKGTGLGLSTVLTIVKGHGGFITVYIYAQNQSEISLVLLDMMMPILDTSTIIQTLQRLNPQVKIVAMSGLAPNEAIATSHSTSIQAFLAKPFTAYELLQTLHQLIKTRVDQK